MPPKQRKRKSPSSAKATSSTKDKPPSPSPFKLGLEGEASSSGMETPVKMTNSIALLDESDIVVGSRYRVVGGEWSSQPGGTAENTYLAEILAIRSNTQASEGKEFYVHFNGLDKRLDEWVGFDRIVSKYEHADQTSISASPSRGRSRSGSGHKRARFNSTGDVNKIDGQDLHQSNNILSRSSVHSHGHHDPKTKVRNIHRVQFGGYAIESWYYSPYPDKYGDNVDTLYICEHTFKYMLNRKTFDRHSKTCPKQPPGRKIYEDNIRNIAAFEIVGEEHPSFCQNLCLFAKLFIEHKTLYYDVLPFKFYLLTEKDDSGYHPVAYYSKENESNENYNLACILTFPPHQRKGYGRFLMSLSYEMSKKAGILGSPEKPLSDLGKISYRSFWTYCILSFLRQQPIGYIVKLEDIVKSTGFKREDIISTMHALRMLKEWKGQYVIHYTRSEIGKILEPYDRKKFNSSFCKVENLIHES